MTYVTQNAVLDLRMQFESSENALAMSIWCKYLVQQIFYVTTLDKAAYNLLYNNVL